MAIQFPGYKPVIKNAFYVGRGEKPLVRGAYSMPDGLFIMKYTLPDAAQIIRYLQKKAAKVSVKSKKRAANNNWEQGIELALSGLPSFVLDDLKAGKGPVIDYVQKAVNSNLSSRMLQTYLQADSGLIADSAVSMARKKPACDAINIVQPALADRTSLSIKLYNSQLLPKKEMDVLRRHGVSESYSLSVKDGKYSPAVDKLVEILYSGLSSPSAVAEVTDMSERALLEPVGLALIPLANMFRLGSTFGAALESLTVLVKASPPAVSAERLFGTPN